MLRKINFVVLIAFVLALLATSLIFYSTNKKSPDQKKTAVSDAKKIAAVSPGDNSFFVSGWIPYWRKTEGVASLQGNLNLFSEINPFAFSVAPDGSLIDTAQINSAPWSQLFQEAKAANVQVVPTILWTDALAMHKVFTDPTLLDNHIDAIVSMLKKNNFPGVDIDYEGKDVADRNNFSSFLEDLHQKLQPLGKTLDCTVEARTQDLPPTGWTGTRAMSYANDFSALDQYCDSVRVMAYDEVFQVYRAQSFENTASSPYAPNADNQWVKQVLEYALRYISPQKLILGIPTYGWEFHVTKTANTYEYTDIGSISYPAAIAEAKAHNVVPQRTSGGELSFTYLASDGEHLVTFEDAASIRQKISIAQTLHIEGISLFKIDGSSDPQLFPMLNKTLK